MLHPLHAQALADQRARHMLQTAAESRLARQVPRQEGPSLLRRLITSLWPQPAEPAVAPEPRVPVEPVIPRQRESARDGARDGDVDARQSLSL